MDYLRLPGTPILRSVTRITTALLVLGGAAACSDHPCVGVPCALPTALVLSVTSATTGVPIDTVDITLRSPGTGEIHCGGTCYIQGNAGTYAFTVSGPGFRPVDRSIQVTGSSADCGCGTVDTEHLSIALSPAT